MEPELFPGTCPVGVTTHTGESLDKGRHGAGSHNHISVLPCTLACFPEVS